MPAPAAAARSKFELPQLKPVNFSLTDGTDIPPPPDSPTEEEKPAPPVKEAPPQIATNVAATPPKDANGGDTHMHDAPAPTSPTRPSSIRRFLSRKSLNTSYNNGNHNASSENLAVAGAKRPESPASFMTNNTGLKKRKSGPSWFKRLNRTSVVYENARSESRLGNGEQERTPMGPPPPRLPELNQLEAKIVEGDEGSLGGDDIFKNIK